MKSGVQLDLFEGMECGDVRVPWDGRSPRDLTQAGMNPIFKAQAVKKRERSGFDAGQLDLWLAKSEGPRRDSGAPSLLPLPWEG